MEQEEQVFPELNLQNLKIYAKRWAEEHYPCLIKRVVLYSYEYSPPSPHLAALEKLLQKRLPVRFAVVFEVYPGNERFERFLEEFQNWLDGFSICELKRTKVEPGRRLKVLTDPSYVTSPDRGDSRHYLMGPSFCSSVYKGFPFGTAAEGMKNALKAEWDFFTKELDSKLPSAVRTNEPHWVLYDANASRLGEVIPPDREVDQKPELPRCEPGTKWSQVTITLVPGGTDGGQPMVRIKIPHYEKLCTYHLLRMYHKQNPGKPTRMWYLLVWFAKESGKIVKIPDGEEFRKLINQKKPLDHHLQKLFGIKDTIYKGHAKSCRGHETKIEFRSEVYLPTIEPRSSRTRKEPRSTMDEPETALGSDAEEDLLIAAIDAQSEQEGDQGLRPAPRKTKNRFSRH